MMWVQERQGEGLQPHLKFLGGVLTAVTQFLFFKMSLPSAFIPSWKSKKVSVSRLKRLIVLKMHYPQRTWSLVCCLQGRPEWEASSVFPVAQDIQICVLFSVKRVFTVIRSRLNPRPRSCNWRKKRGIWCHCKHLVIGAVFQIYRCRSNYVNFCLSINLTYSWLILNTLWYVCLKCSDVFGYHCKEECLVKCYFVIPVQVPNQTIYDIWQVSSS